MNRKLLIQVAAPTVVIGLLLLGVCLAGAWHINRLQTNLTRLLSRNVASLQAAQGLEIHVRRLRYHTLLYLLSPPAQRPQEQKQVEDDQQDVERSLELVRGSASTAEERACVAAIEDGYRRYRNELAELRQDRPPTDPAALMAAHPVQLVVDPCGQLLDLNKQAMRQTAEESSRVSGRLSLAMLLLGLGGPVSGLLSGYGIARGLSRSIYRLSVRVQDMAQHLDRDVAALQLTPDGDITRLDRQLQHVVGRVAEVAESLQRHQRELLRAEQLAAVGQMAAGVAHEVRNPLTSIKMLVEAARRRGGGQALTGEDLEVIHGEVVRLEGTVQGFLDFARPPRPRRSACDLAGVVAGAADLVRARARQQGVAIDLRGPGGPVPAEVDREQIRTVLVNLFLNALDAMPRGGRLGVELEAGRPAGAVLRVSDTGGGIAPEIAGRLFTPFATTKPAGTGLGLSISRRLVEEHGGRISAANRPGGGAVFTIVMPAHPFSRDPQGSAAPRSPAGRG
jgi:signal transduction histidine kinase